MDKRKLSKNDSDLIAKFLKDSPEPNDALKSIYKKVMRIYQIDNHGQSVYNVDSEFGV